MLEISVDAVIDAARSLLANGKGNSKGNIKSKNGGPECPAHTEAAHG